LVRFAAMGGASGASKPKVLVERRDAVTVLTLNRPEVHNCVDGETALSLGRAIEGFASDDDERVLVVTGAGDRSFSSGADLRHTDELWTHELFEEAGPVGFALLDPGKPVVAAVNGYCFAGGMELAAWCDVRIASEHAEFGILNRRWGIPLIDGGTQRLPRIVGLGNALYLIETGVRIGVAEARAMGFVQEIVPRGLALERAVALAERIAAYPQTTVRSDRQAALATFGVPLSEGLRLEHRLGAAALKDPEMAAAIRRYDRGDRPEPPRPS
jgi:enoyl-CoA hydratase